MQRISAILMLALFSFALVAPVLSADSDAKLPPCCRRDGKHHCGMKTQKPASAGIVIRESMRYSMFGKAGVMPVAAKVITVAPMELVSALLVSHPAAIEQTEARYRVSYSRSSQKRGPPSLLS